MQFETVFCCAWAGISFNHEETVGQFRQGNWWDGELKRNWRETGVHPYLYGEKISLKYMGVFRFGFDLLYSIFFALHGNSKTWVCT